MRIEQTEGEKRDKTEAARKKMTETKLDVSAGAYDRQYEMLEKRAAEATDSAEAARYFDLIIGLHQRQGEAKAEQARLEAAARLLHVTKADAGKSDLTLTLFCAFVVAVSAIFLGGSVWASLEGRAIPAPASPANWLWAALSGLLSCLVYFLFPPFIEWLASRRVRQEKRPPNKQEQPLLIPFKE